MLPDQLGPDREPPRASDAPLPPPGVPLEDSILVPERSVGTDLGGKYVMLVGEDGICEQRYVTLDDVVIDGMVRIEEGLEVFASHGARSCSGPSGSGGHVGPGQSGWNRTIQKGQGTGAQPRS